MPSIVGTARWQSCDAFQRLDHHFGEINAEDFRSSLAYVELVFDDGMEVEFDHR